MVHGGGGGYHPKIFIFEKNVYFHLMHTVQTLCKVRINILVYNYEKIIKKLYCVIQLYTLFVGQLGKKTKKCVLKSAIMTSFFNILPSNNIFGNPCDKMYYWSKFYAKRTIFGDFRFLHTFFENF